MESPRWYDSHCHVSSERFDEDRALVVARAREAGVALMIDIGCEQESWQGSLALARAEDDVVCALGIHPHEAKTWSPELAEQLTALAAEPEVVAVGEMGLDFHYDHSPRDTQRAVFREQLALSVRLGMPAVLHIRDAHEEAAAIIAEQPAARGIIHCFTGGPADAERYLAQGFFISFSGIVTFKKAEDNRAAALMVPTDRILVETDAPYLAPAPKRGKRCEPAFVARTGAFLAELRGQEAAAFAEQTRANTRQAFALDEASGA